MRMKILALIPARAGSKRLPHKNSLKLNGKTLVEHAVEQAIGSRFINKIVISTNDEEILHDTFHKNWISFEPRPNNLCKDDTGSEEVIRHIEKKHKPDIIVLLQPTSPIRYSRDIDLCISLLLMSDLDCVMTVDNHNHPNGNIYVVRKGKSLWSVDRALVVQDKMKSIDIDDQIDYDLAKMVLENT